MATQRNDLSAERRKKAGVPDDVSFATKPKIGVAMAALAIEAGVPCAWVLGDSVYGSDKSLRVMLIESSCGRAGLRRSLTSSGLVENQR